MDDGGFPHLISVVSWVCPVRCSEHPTPDMFSVFHKAFVCVQLSFGSALSASVADSLSALLGDGRIWGSEEDPQFPADSSLFTKSLDILFLRLYDGSRGNQGS